MKCRIALSAVILALATAPAMSHAAGVVLFSNLDSNNSATGSATIIGGPGNFFNDRVAAAFTTPNDGTTDVFGTAEVVVAQFSDPSATLDLRLYSDINGLPGLLLDTMTLTTPLGDANTNPTTALLTSTTHPLLFPNTTYWIGLTAGANESLLWLNNSVGDSRPTADNGGDPSVTWETFGDAAPAFRITSFVPEPSAALLACCAAAPLLRRRPR